MAERRRRISSWVICVWLGSIAPVPDGRRRDLRRGRRRRGPLCLSGSAIQANAGGGAAWLYSPPLLGRGWGGLRPCAEEHESFEPAGADPAPSPPPTKGRGMVPGLVDAVRVC